MTLSDTVIVKLLHTLDNIVMSAIGATVFIFGLIHATPLTSMAVEYVGVFGTYFGVHVFTSNAVSKAGVAASTSAVAESEASAAKTN